MGLEAERGSNWIDVYPFSGRGLSINNTGDRFSLNPDLARFVEENWKPKAEKGWRSSWVPFAKRVSFTDSGVTVETGVMRYHEIDGMNKALEEGLPSAPLEGFVPCLSVSFLTATRDGHIILRRRSADVHVPDALTHEPCGYMTSRDIPLVRMYEKPEHANNPRLFDVETQLNTKARYLAEAFGIDPEAVTYKLLQDFLAAGWITTEMYFSTTGTIDEPTERLIGIDRAETVFIPPEDLLPLLLNQGRLAGVDMRGRKTNIREIPLTDETVVGVLFGYEDLTGDTLDIGEIVDRLNHDGLNIRIFDTHPGIAYQFPASA